MRKVALTGGIACGKSLVGAYFAAGGLPVCDADDLAHQALAPGQEPYRRVIEMFGRELVRPDGTLDRRELGRRVFGNREALARLNALVHPSVRAAWEAWLRDQRAARRDCAVVILPLLYEIGEETRWDTVVCVVAPRELQIARLRNLGFTEEEVHQRLAAQMDPWDKAERADMVIVNAGGIDVLQRQTGYVLDALRRRT